MSAQVSLSDEEYSPGTCAIIFVRGTLDVPQDTLVSEGREGMVYVLGGGGTSCHTEERSR